MENIPDGGKIQHFPKKNEMIEEITGSQSSFLMMIQEVKDMLLLVSGFFKIYCFFSPESEDGHDVFLSEHHAYNEPVFC